MSEIIEVGSQVRITRGPYRGREGIVTGINSPIISVDMFSVYPRGGGGEREFHWSMLMVTASPGEIQRELDFDKG